jgi:hypothetical protein
MSEPRTERPTPISNAGDAERAIANLYKIMDSLEATLTEETARVRAGKLRHAIELEQNKVELSRSYVAESQRLNEAKSLVAQSLPEAFSALRKRHEGFQALLRTNLTVLATAHAVAEGIIRGVSRELASKRAPSTYGATGRANAPSPRATEPLAMSRVL